MGGAAGLLDHSVDRFGAAVADPAGVEVGQDLLRQARRGSVRAGGDFGDRADGQAADDLLGSASAFGGFGAC